MRTYNAGMEVRCPSCFQTFVVSGPGPAECPAEWDYDCEICCRPMLIDFFVEDGEIRAAARGIND